MEEDDVMICKLLADSVEGCLLGIAEGFHAVEVFLSGIVKPAYLLFICIQYALVGKSLYCRKGGMRLVHQLLAGDGRGCFDC